MTADRRWMEKAIDLSRRCPPSATAFSVGAIVVSSAGVELARGYSRETDEHVHAEESALSKLPRADLRLRTATIYSTLEPCAQRKSRPRTCVDLILEAGIPRVAMAWHEPGTFVSAPRGFEKLTAAGVTVIEMPELAAAAMAVNSHLEA